MDIYYQYTPEPFYRGVLHSRIHKNQRHISYETNGARSSLRAYVPQMSSNYSVIIHTYGGVHKFVLKTTYESKGIFTCNQNTDFWTNDIAQTKVSNVFCLIDYCIFHSNFIEICSRRYRQQYNECMLMQLLGCEQAISHYLGQWWQNFCSATRRHRTPMS